MDRQGQIKWINWDAVSITRDQSYFDLWDQLDKPKLTHNQELDIVKMNARLCRMGITFGALNNIERV